MQRAAPPRAGRPHGNQVEGRQLAHALSLVHEHEHEEQEQEGRQLRRNDDSLSEAPTADVSRRHTLAGSSFAPSRRQTDTGPSDVGGEDSQAAVVRGEALSRVRAPPVHPLRHPAPPTLPRACVCVRAHAVRRNPWDEDEESASFGRRSPPRGPPPPPAAAQGTPGTPSRGATRHLSLTGELGGSGALGGGGAPGRGADSRRVSMPGSMKRMTLQDGLIGGLEDDEPPAGSRRPFAASMRNSRTSDAGGGSGKSSKATSAGGGSGRRSGTGGASSGKKLAAAQAALYAPAADLAPVKQSPAVVAALAGRTMLRQVSLPGRHFERAIPSLHRHEDGEASEHWRAAAKAAKAAAQAAAAFAAAGAARKQSRESRKSRDGGDKEP